MLSKPQSEHFIISIASFQILLATRAAFGLVLARQPRVCRAVRAVMPHFFFIFHKKQATGASRLCVKSAVLLKV